MSILDARLKTAPTDEPVTLDEAKEHLRVDHGDEDALIDSLIVAARKQAESEGWLSCCTQTWTLYLTGWPGAPLLLPRHPVQSIVSLKYYDADDVAQTVATTVYTLTPAPGEDAHLWLKAAQEWPSAELSERLYPVEVEYVTGYGNGVDVPADIRQWLLLRIGSMYENRESVQVVPGVSNSISLDFADSLLSDHRGFRY